MEKLQLMMFEAIGYKLTFNPEVTKRYFNILQTRFGKNSEMEKHMNGFVTDGNKQQEIISDHKHMAHEEFKRLAQMQLKDDIRKLQQQIAQQPSSPFVSGRQTALRYLEAINELRKVGYIIPQQIANAEYVMITAINESIIDDDSDPKITSSGVDCPTINLVFRTMICYNDSLQTNAFNYLEAKETVKAIFKLCISLTQA